MPSELSVFRDSVSQATVRQLTDYKGHSHHLYFTNSGWFDGGRRLLFGSDRAGRTNLFSVCLASGEIAQHTDADMPGAPCETSFLFCSLNPARPEAYFWRGRQLIAIDLVRNRERLLYAAAEEMAVDMTSVTADGRYVLTGLVQDAGDRFPLDLLHGYVGFRQRWAAKPLSILLAVPVDGGPTREIFRENYWMGHVSASPTVSSLVMFCHEGPWGEVDHRIWCCDIDSGRVWPVGPRRPGDAIGHEYWLQDGVRIGYHGVTGGASVIGFARYDSQDAIEFSVRHKSRHVFSLDDQLIVGDGVREYLLIWRRAGETLEGPAVLCEHGSSSFMQQTHVHPRMGADGKQVVFTSDRRGYGNVYLVEMPAFESLPLLSQVRSRAAI
jgi:oligogalacturonide lyase